METPITQKSMSRPGPHGQQITHGYNNETTMYMSIFRAATNAHPYEMGNIGTFKCQAMTGGGRARAAAVRAVYFGNAVSTLNQPRLVSQ